ncbi:MAG TPA: SAM-dependent methyltransferase [Candidatus Omnitrophota bacterium]|nr:SAM-dependent methyltransferase [Candidatus Omnitrophota bacterium]HPB68034.1 SAM-dependent methyltransferase [Candidatus Omnitrophota bacterium]HQO57739.1 SAM-dependent methyltransferase [Candidatus Omnitrophota bacterium]HQP12427.1 SAM-dependent methyltransferase [Candidatus Omnitrophota bacterium]
MALKYKNVVPWGRNFEEYRRMFDLRENELTLRILGCGDGPASFNWECNQKGGRVISVDPLYNLTRQEIQSRIQETYKDVMAQTERDKDKFKWDSIKSVAALGEVRMKAMSAFLDSYEEGKIKGRYIPAALPDLPFPNDAFDLSLCSHFLFLYTEQLSYEFHVKAIKEMLRVSREARFFPLLDLNAGRSPYISKILLEFQAECLEIRKVAYEFQIGGNELLIIKKTGRGG